jgi:two-component system sensor histidine kinase BaeS
MKMGLRLKLSLAFLLITMLLITTVSVLANFFLEKQFKAYIIDKQAQKNKDIVALLASRYSDWGDQWDLNGLESIGVNTLGEGILIRVHDGDGDVLWDARVHNNGMCTSILQHMASNMQAYDPGFSGGYVEANYPIILNGNSIGGVDIGYYGPYFYSDTDLQFLKTLNVLLFWAAVIAALASLIIGAVLARQLSRPIVKVIHSAQKIAKGDYKDRITGKSSTREIIELTETINSLAETLGKQEALRKRLTADVAHELRTPIATLQSHLEAMIDGTWKADAKRLGSCHEEIVRLSSLVGDIEKLTRYEGENLVLNIKRFDIYTLLQRVVSNYRIEYRKKNVSLDLDGSEEFIEADEDKISQVVINLLSNALKYTPEGGSVGITMKSSEHFTEIIIADNGIGIASEDLPNIFERFYRTDKSRTRLTGGTGIGLAIAKTIMDAHHGDITVLSEPGKGSVFTIILHKIYTSD